MTGPVVVLGGEDRATACGDVVRDELRVGGVVDWMGAMRVGRVRGGGSDDQEHGGGDGGRGRTVVCPWTASKLGENSWTRQPTERVQAHQIAT